MRKMIIEKVGAAIIAPGNSEILVVRKKGKDSYIIPGGRPENGETHEQTLRRELREELCVEVSGYELLGSYVERAEYEDAELRMTVYLTKIDGAISPDNEIAECRWVHPRKDLATLRLGSTLTNHVIPRLFNDGILAR